MSYAYDDQTRDWVPALVDAARRAGIRMVFDRDGIDVSGGSFESTLAALLPRLNAVVAVVNPTYLKRALVPDSGISSDLKVIEDHLLLDPLAESRFFVLLDGETSADELPPALVVSERLRVRAGSEVDGPARVLAGSIAAPGKTQAEPVAFNAVVPRLHGLADSEALRYAAGWTDRSSGLITTASLVAGLLQREADQASDRRLPGVERTPFVGRLLGLLSSWASIGPARLGVVNTPRASPPPLSAQAFSALRWATYLARSVGAPRTQPLHLLASVLVRHAPWREEVDRLLTMLELNRDDLAQVVHSLGGSGDPGLGFTAQLQTRLRAALRVTPPGPSKIAFTTPTPEPPTPPAPEPNAAPVPPAEPDAAPAAMPEALGDLAQPDRGVASLDPDSPSGLDRLNITSDVNALAKVLASWRLAPPLAVGLFGEWGSGKTFFMRLLRDQIGVLSKSARERKTTLQRDEAYCKHIAQVEFNAWHYSEGDLWAGMVHHIFSNLRVDPKDSPAKLAERQQAALTALRAAEGVAADKAEQYRKSAERAADAEVAKTDAEARAAEAVSKLQISVREAISMLSGDEQMRALAGRALERAGLTNDTRQAVKQVQSALQNARTEGGRLAGIGRRLKDDVREHPWRTLLLFALVLGLGPALTMALQGRALDAAGDLVKQVVFFAPTIVSIAGFAAATMARVSSVLDEPRRRYAQEHQKKIDALQKEADARKAEASLARTEADQAVVQVSVARAEIQRLDPSRLLSEFLAERAGSKDYRDKLGLLATVRNDFDRLSELMLRQKKAEEDGDAASKESGELRLNRIILYIDDLDRCPPERVVKVLQAIHLLLAFDLFVVVVGVDARWVQRSLRHQYKLMLRADGRPDDEGDEDRDSIATPRDYLEKIFQIPFWLPTLAGADYADLIQALAQPKPADGAEKPVDAGNAPIQTALTVDPPQAATDAAASPIRTDAGLTAAPSPPLPNADGAPANPPTANPASADATTPAPAGAPAANPPTSPPAPPKEVPERADVLHLDDREVAVMKDLADLYGRSPRAVKRFVNCYRLFKSMLLEHGRQAYIPPVSAAYQPFELALLLLAVVVGSPSAARRLVDEVARPANDAVPLRSLFKPPPATAPEAAWGEWRRLERLLDRIPAALTTKQSRDMVFRAWRFSFRSADADRDPKADRLLETKPTPQAAAQGKPA